MGWLLPLGPHRVMGSFAGYSVSVCTFKSVRLFLQRLVSSDVAICWIPFLWTFFSSPEDLVQFVLHIPFNFSSASRLLGCHFFVAALSTLSVTRSSFVFPMSEEDLRCVKKTGDA